jgi:hypothetical protein
MDRVGLDNCLDTRICPDNRFWKQARHRDKTGTDNPTNAGFVGFPTKYYISANNSVDSTTLSTASRALLYLPTVPFICDPKIILGLDGPFANRRYSTLVPQRQNSTGNYKNTSTNYLYAQFTVCMCDCPVLYQNTRSLLYRLFVTFSQIAVLEHTQLARMTDGRCGKNPRRVCVVKFCFHCNNYLIRVLEAASVQY